MPFEFSTEKDSSRPLLMKYKSDSIDLLKNAISEFDFLSSKLSQMQPDLMILLLLWQRCQNPADGEEVCKHLDANKACKPPAPHDLMKFIQRKL